MIESSAQTRYDWLTYSRIRVLRELAAGHTEAQGADNVGIQLTGFRSIVEDIKGITGLNSVREIGRWWRSESPKWLAWLVEQASWDEEGTLCRLLRVPKVS